MEEKKKSNVGLIVIVVILLLACIGMGCYIGYDKFLSDNKCITEEYSNTETNSKKEKETTKEASESQEVLNTKYCEGAYTYNDNIPVGDGELHKQVLTLKNDGTFSGSRNDTTKEEGTYIIKDDTIIFIYHPETYGGPDNASYTSSSYYISSDCSYMSYEYRKMDSTPVTVKLTK